MWTQIKLIWATWKVALLAMVIACLTLFGAVQTWRLSEAQGAITEVKVIERIADEQAEKNHEHLAAAIPLMLEQAKNSWAAAQARFPAAPAGNAACGIRADSVLPAFGGGQDDLARRDEPAEPQRLAVDPAFIRGCAEDAGYRDLFVRACLANPLICEFKE